jgi:hypothetical protein
MRVICARRFCISAVSLAPAGVRFFGPAGAWNSPSTSRTYVPGSNFLPPAEL